MKKGILVVLVVVAILLVGWLVLGNTPNYSGDISGTEVSAEGIITNVDASQAALDGPVLLTIDADGEEEIIAVPTMGINLCAARENMADAFALEEGQFVDVRGSRDSEGRIVPCESTSHYLRVSAE